MARFTRIAENPFLSPIKEHAWEAQAVFNPCVVKDKNIYHLVYRAQSSPTLSSIGYAESRDGIHFQNRRQFIAGEQDFERFGCEDPRVTKLNDKYYIFYTALSVYPFSADGIRVGMAITKDFKTIEAKHPVTPFNSKAMALLPELINGKMAAILTVNTDRPPAKIALAFFDREDQIWSEKYWAEWYSSLDSHVIPLLRTSNDHLEVGAPPIKTPKGWLILYSYIRNYRSDARSFCIEAALLDLNNPLKVIGRTSHALLVAEKDYELHGDVNNVVFPTGAVVDGDELALYYGAADTRCCLAVGKVNELLDEMLAETKPVFIPPKTCAFGELKRYSNNPIIAPRPEFAWEAKATFNPGVIYEGERVHLIYRAMGHDDTSVFGYASSSDGVHFDERLREPIYTPRELFESKRHPGNSGCEDPRLTRLGDKIYLFYTAYDGYTPRVAFTSISVNDFLNHRWNFEKSKVITAIDLPDKDACLLSEKVDEKYVIFHRPEESISINFVDDLLFANDQMLSRGTTLLRPRDRMLHTQKVGMAGPPVKTEAGWLMLYHWVTDGPERVYEIGAALLSFDETSQMVSDSRVALLQPETDYERVGLVNQVVFSCGSAVLNDCLYLYYGGADMVIGVARVKLERLLNKLQRSQ